MSFQVKGKVIEVCPSQSGTSAAGKPWEKQDFVIEEIEGNFPKRIAFTAFNNPDIFNFIGLNDKVTVHFNAESKEFKEKWFTNLTIWKVDVDVKAAGSAPTGSGSGMTNYPPPPPPMEEPYNTGVTDDSGLPF